MNFRPGAKIGALLLIAALLLPACSPAEQLAGGKLVVVATTTIVGDVVRNIGGEWISLSVIIPPNVDEHAYEPTPQDVAKVAEASLVFESGAGLEQFIDKLMRNAGGAARLVSVSDGLKLLQGPVEGENGSPGSGDPHVWMDPLNVQVWAANIEKALSEADPAHAPDYQKNAEAYRQKLTTLDAWIQQQVSLVPQQRRKLVTDHLVFTYFASRYGFEQVGAVIPGYSTMASPSAQELAALEDNIQKLGVPVIFVGNTVNPALEQRVAADTHTRLVQVLTGSLTDANGPAPTYVDYIHYDVNAIVSALK